ncbi:MAG TPA: DUF4105 domain-containing protein [Steroidobacteraceae bacterium]
MGANTSLALESVAAESGWLKLGHYAPDRHSTSGWRSAIHPGDFFLDPAGAQDPLRELQATLAAFALPPTTDANQHAQCRFPARWLWLKTRLSGHPALATKVPCPAYEKWTRSDSVESLSVVFATGYLGNPASYYGHVLLKFNFREAEGQTRLLDVSVNYGAIVETRDNPFKYMLKGLFGKYDGGFSHIEFYFQNHNYGEVELRDLWEYRLDLPKDAVELVVAHAWEVLGKRYTYYFFQKNCAYRMGEVLQVVDGLKIIPDETPWVIPQVMIRTIARSQFRGRPLLAGVYYLPSRQSRFYAKFTQLPPADVSLFTGLVVGRWHLDDPEFVDRPTLAKQAVLDALLDYYQFVGDPLDRAPQGIQEAYRRALSARYMLEPGTPALTPSQPVAPDRGRAPGWLQVGNRHDSVTGNALVLRLRPAYYDVLDSGPGQVRNAALAMADMEFAVNRGRLHITRFTVIDVESVNPGLSGLPGDRGAAWKLGLGAEQERLGCGDCLVARAQGDLGLGRQWSGLFGAVYAGGAVQSDRLHEGFGFTRAKAEIIVRAGEHLGLQCSYEQRFPIGSGFGSYGVSSIEGRWSPSARTDLRVGYAHDGAQSVRIGLGMYW